MKYINGILLVGGLSALSFHAVADIAALNTAASKLCDKSKMCLKQEMAAGEELPPGMETMINNMLDEMCKQYISIADLGQQHEVIEPATACLNSMAEKSCDDLLNADAQTPACQRLENVAEKYQ